jgi:ribosomal protein L37AE/L43A
LNCPRCLKYHRSKYKTCKKCLEEIRKAKLWLYYRRKKKYLCTRCGTEYVNRIVSYSVCEGCLNEIKEKAKERRNKKSL